MIPKISGLSWLMGYILVAGQIAVAQAEPKVLFTMDFNQPEISDAPAWLLEQGFDQLLDGDNASENRLRLRTISRLGRLGFRPISRRRRVDG